MRHDPTDRCRRPTVPPRRWSILPALVVALLSAACGGDGPLQPSNGSETPPPPEPGRPREIVTNPSFSEVVQEIFDRKGCTATGCHGATTAGGLDLRPSAAWDALVSIQATAEPFQRVIPGDPQDSYLVIRLEGRQSVGAAMPIGRTPLDSIDLTNVRNWITRGAIRN